MVLLSLFVWYCCHSLWPQYSKTKGWGALYAGIKPCIAATAVSQGLYFYLYSAIRKAVVVSVSRMITCNTQSVPQPNHMT